MTLCTYSNTFNENIQLIDICSRTRDLSLVVVGWKAPGSKRHKDNVKGMNIFAHLHPSHLEALETSWGEVVQINALKQAIFKQYRLTFDSFWLAHFMKPKDDKWERTQVAQIQNTYISNTQNKITTSKVARRTRFNTDMNFYFSKGSCSLTTEVLQIFAGNTSPSANGDVTKMPLEGKRWVWPLCYFCVMTQKHAKYTAVGKGFENMWATFTAAVSLKPHLYLSGQWHESNETTHPKIAQSILSRKDFAMLIPTKRIKSTTSDM